MTSDQFLPSGFTLRFPRVTTLRWDKSFADVESFDELQHRFRDGKAKLASSKRSAAEVPLTLALALSFTLNLALALTTPSPPRPHHHTLTTTPSPSPSPSPSS